MERYIIKENEGYFRNIKLYSSIRMFYNFCDAIEKYVLGNKFSKDHTSFREVCKFDLMALAITIASEDAPISEEEISFINYYFDCSLPCADVNAIARELPPGFETAMNSLETVSRTVETLIAADNFYIIRNMELSGSWFDQYYYLLYEFTYKLIACDGFLTTVELEKVSTYFNKIKKYAYTHHCKPSKVKCLNELYIQKVPNDRSSTEEIKTENNNYNSDEALTAFERMDNGNITIN